MHAEHVLASLLIVSILGALFSQFYVGMQDIYEFTPTGTDESGQNMLDRLAGLNIVSGIDKFTTGVYNLTTPQTLSDILGGLAATGIGFLQVFTGIISFPIEIVGILTSYYIPNEVATGIGLLFTIYMAFYILKARTRTG